MSVTLPIKRLKINWFYQGAPKIPARLRSLRSRVEGPTRFKGGGISGQPRHGHRRSRQDGGSAQPG